MIQLKTIFILILITIFSIGNAKDLDSKQFHKKITDLNNEKKYDESIKAIESIIDNPQSTSCDQYEAYLAKSFTYKRLFNYQLALDNLDKALVVGQKCSYRDEVQSRIKIEQLFIYFDAQENDKLETWLKKITKNDVDKVDIDTKSIYISLLAIIETRKGDYKKADELLNEAIALIIKDNPKDLPNIYRKKISIYQETKDISEAQKAYDLGMYYAEKYHIDIYKINMDEAMVRFYAALGDYKKAYEFQKIVSKRRTDYNHVNTIGKLNLLEKELLEERKNAQLTSEKRLRYLSYVLLFILTGAIILVFMLYRSNRSRRKLIELDNKRIRRELLKLSNSPIESLGAKKKDPLEDLTPRQLEIVELVKQGKTNKEIGSILFISENTVKYHLKIIFNTLEIDNRWDI